MIIDISPEISTEYPVFPGDTQFSHETLLDIKNKDHIHLSSINTTVHIGAHADAPLHYNKSGESIEDRSLNPYWGKCYVFDLSDNGCSGRISPDEINEDLILCPRIIFKTNSFDHKNWSNEFRSLSPELIELLGKHNVVLVGIDTPSIDPSTSKKLESHAQVYKNNMSVLEGLSLSSVKEGQYELVALPLKMRGLDASPVRAALKTL